MSQIINDYKPINCIRGIIKPLSAQVATTSTIYSIPLSDIESTAFVVIPSTYLTANLATGISAILTLTTGVASTETVIIPIQAKGNTLTSDSLMFNIYIDVAGNVYNENFQISGSNANGSYIMFDDGTMECYKYAVAIAGSSVYTWVFPAPFISTGYSFPGGVSVNTAAQLVIGANNQGTGKTVSQIALYNQIIAGSAGTYPFDLYAIGRWK
jgi:hypothetical protein